MYIARCAARATRGALGSLGQRPVGRAPWGLWRREFSQLPPMAPPITTVSATTLDASGTITAISRAFPLAQFLQKHNLFPRDLRKIDTTNVDVAPVIAVRRGSILVNMLFIKALLTARGVYVFDVRQGDTPRQGALNDADVRKLGVFMYDLEAKLTARGTTGMAAGASVYEFRSLECILVNVMAVLESELAVHLSKAKAILRELDSDIDRGKLKSLLVESKRLGVFYQKSALIRDVLDELLDNDDDLQRMHLTNPAEDTADLELMLESYYKQCDELVQRAETMINDIKSTEDIVNIILDANRNSLMVFELRIAIMTLAFTVATIVPAFYGMNLKNYLEESEVAFAAVVGSSIFVGILVSLWWFRKLHNVKRMTIVSSKGLDRWDDAQKRGMLKRIRDATAKPQGPSKGTPPHRKDVVWRWLVNENRK